MTGSRMLRLGLAMSILALSTRLPRRRLQELAGLNGMYHLNGLLTVCGQDLVIPRTRPRPSPSP